MPSHLSTACLLKVWLALAYVTKCNAYSMYCTVRGANKEMKKGISGKNTNLSTVFEEGEKARWKTEQLKFLRSN